MLPSNIVIMGAGKHMTDKLAPALLRLQNESNEVKIIAIVRADPNKGTIKDVNVPVYKSIEEIPVESFNTIVACGPPSLHLIALKYASLHQKKVFVEKPHVIFTGDLGITESLPKGSMIGYNFNFMPFINETDITSIIVGTKGLYKDWGSIFPVEIEDYMYAIHSVVVHPISVLIQKYGRPDNVEVHKMKDNDGIEMTITLKYGDQCRSIHYTSKAKEFFMNCYGQKEYECKPYKSATYYDMLKYFLSNDVMKINTFEVGKEVMNVIDKCENLMMD